MSDVFCVRIDAVRCQGHARCVVAAPDVFKLDEWGHSYVESETFPVALLADAKNAAANCPENAIEILEE